MESPISDASSDSQVIEEINSPTTHVTYYELRDVLKSSRDASENLYVVEEATVFFSGNSTQLANVLTHAKPNRKLRLRGRIVADEDQEDQLIVYQHGMTLNGMWIVHEGDFSGFSIAYPNTLWIPTPLGHLEIRASRQYHGIFTEMMHAIGIYYVALFHYEGYGMQDGYSKDYNHMAAILNFVNYSYNLHFAWANIDKYSVHVDGTGLFFKEIIGIATKYSTFMLNEYNKEKTKGDLRGNHMFFNWLQDGCKVYDGMPVARTECRDMSPEKYRQYFAKARLRMKREYGSPEPPPTISEPSPHYQPQRALYPSVTSSATNSLTMKKPFHGSYISPQFPNGIKHESSIAEKIAALICHAVSSGRRQLDKLTIHNVGGAVHRDYSISYRHVCNELVVMNRSSILAYLPTGPPWSTSELYRELASQNYPSAIPSGHHDLAKMQDIVKDFVSGTKSLVHRENKSFTTSSSVTTSSVTASSAPTPVVVAPTNPSTEVVSSDMPILPNRHPAIISISPTAPDQSLQDDCQTYYGVQRSTYGSLGMYE